MQINTNNVCYRDKFKINTQYNCGDFTDYIKSDATIEDLNANSNNQASVFTVFQNTTNYTLPTQNTSYTTNNDGTCTVGVSVEFSFIETDPERKLYSFISPGNCSYAFEYALESTDENPVVDVKSVDQYGNYYEQKIYLNNVDPCNATYAEFTALYCHINKGDETAVPVSRITGYNPNTKAFETPSLTEKHNYFSRISQLKDTIEIAPIESDEEVIELAKLEQILQSLQNHIDEFFDDLYDRLTENTFDEHEDYINFLDKTLKEEFQATKWLKL